MRPPKRSLVALALCMLVATAMSDVAAKDKKKDKAKAEPPASVRVERWLVLGPAAHPLPVFFEKKAEGEGDGADAGGGDPKKDPALGADPFDGDWPRPREGAEVVWFDGRALRWTEARSDGRDGHLVLEPAGGLPSLALAALYVTVDRWADLKLVIEGTHEVCAWLDGSQVIDCKSSEDGHEGSLELTPGSHLVVVQTRFDPERASAWTLAARIEPQERTGDVQVSLGISPGRVLDITDVLDAPNVDSLAISPDGERIALIYTRYVPGSNEAEKWIEVRDTVTGRLVEARRESGASQVAWSPDGRYLSWIGASGEKTQALYLCERATGRTVPLLDAEEKLGGYKWSPDARGIVFSTTEVAKPDERGVKRVQGLMDRWADFRDKQYLHLLTVPGGMTRRLTGGDAATAAQDFSPDGKRLLFSRQLDDYAERPYSRTELWEVDLATFEAKKLRDFRWLTQARYAPDGARVLVMSQPAEFGGLGEDVPDGWISNSYDQQLFLWEPTTGRADPITLGFRPSVTSAEWSAHDGHVYLIATDGSYRRLYRYEVERRTFSEIDTGLEVLDALDPARRAPFAAVAGSSTWMPERLAIVDLRTLTARRIEHPGDAWFADVRRGRVEPWSFDAANGRHIDGYVYLPPDFDPARRWPAIVYYYGGVSPVERSFGGRYPKEWWASNGYVVYVLQPSGAVGFGQAFSAAHVNDWGKTTSEEIIEGTRRFLETHPYVDPARVGCIGASYGGFMTMLLATKTDLYAAAVAHAGISSLSSYWGEGYWGYAYNAVSAAGSFPWNRPDVYVGQSPLFHADQVRVPILLTHGRSDTNVPVGESDAFFVALKLLGKQVEYVQVEGQDHWILEHDKRIVWSRTILAWFDRWLRGQPAWWDDLYED